MLALLLALMIPGLARGDSALGAGDRPWQRGVTLQQQNSAEREFLAGNALFERSEYGGAAVRYRQALAFWAHPSIQFNLAVCLIYLEKPVDAHDMLQAALRFGREALKDHFDEANNYLRLLRGQISTLEVQVPDGAAVTLDGEALTAIAGQPVRRRLVPGRHSLVARKAQFETWSKDLVLAPGETTREVITLRPPRIKTVRRWSVSKPWWVVGGGGAVAGFGSAALLVGNANTRAVTAEVTRTCPPPVGCPKGLPSALTRDRDRARLEQRVGVSMLTMGAAMVVTGVILLVLNQPRQVLDQPGLVLRVSPQEVTLAWGHEF
jgi:hypothetical protein